MRRTPQAESVSSGMPPLPTVDPTPVVFWGLTQKVLLTTFAPAILTGLLALLGAWVGFGLANRGRKYDILYKERYKSFEELAAYLYAVRDTFDKLIILSEEVSELINEQPSKHFVDDIRIGLGKLSNSEQPNARYLVLMSPRTRKRYFETLDEIEKLTRVLIEIDLNSEGVLRDAYVFRQHQAELGSQIKITSASCEATIASAIRDVNLPKR